LLLRSAAVAMASFVQGGPDAATVGFDDVAPGFGVVVARGTAELQAAKTRTLSAHPMNIPAFECPLTQQARDSQKAREPSRHAMN
jgi:hypothetical protein